MRAKSPFIVVVGTTTAFVLAGLVFSFMLFAANATRQSPGEPPRADGIVVLTGGELRIAEGGRLLLQRFGQRLLVSGVHARTSEADVRRLANLPPELFACCVDLDRAALDTHGNAIETRRWAARHDFRSLIVVTGSYHMMRSRLELERALPGVRLHAHAVVPRSLRQSAWWLNPSSARVLVGEYLKLLPVAVRHVAAQLNPIAETPAPSAAGGGRPPRNDVEGAQSMSRRVGSGN